MFRLQFVSMGEADDVLILDYGVGPSLLIALAEIDRQICVNCGPEYSLWSDSAFDLNEFRKVMASGTGATYSRRDPESPDDDFDLILR